MGDNVTFWGCTALWAISSIATYWLGTKLTWLWGGKSVAKDHDPDRAFVQPIVLWRAGVTAGLMTLLLGTVMWLFVTIYAGLQLRSFTIFPDFVRDLGLQLESSTLDSLQKDFDGLLPNKLSSNRKGMKSKIVRAFTGGNDGLTSSDKAYELTKDYIEQEVNKNAVQALSDFLRNMGDTAQLPDSQQASSRDATSTENTVKASIPGIGEAKKTDNGKPASIDPRKFESHLWESLVPWNLESQSAKQFMARLMQSENFRAFHDRLEKKFTDEPASEFIVLSIFDRIRKKVADFHRVKLIFLSSVDHTKPWTAFTSVQLWTVYAYFLALILLAGRARLIEWQSRCPDWFVEYYNTGGEPANLPWRDSVESKLDCLFPRSMFLSDPKAAIAGYQSEREKITKGMAYLASHQREPVDRFVLGALDRIYDSLITSLTKKLTTSEAEVAAREVLNNLAERAEARVERVEYAAINYLLWVLPSLGFIGTIVGIGDSLGKADQVVRASDALGRAEAITQVTSLLGFAFDTTLIALICGIPVMALLYAYRSRESQLILDIQQQIGNRLL